MSAGDDQPGGCHLIGLGIWAKINIVFDQINWKPDARQTLFHFGGSDSLGSTRSSPKCQFAISPQASESSVLLPGPSHDARHSNSNCKLNW